MTPVLANDCCIYYYGYDNLISKNSFQLEVLNRKMISNIYEKTSLSVIPDLAKMYKFTYKHILIS